MTSFSPQAWANAAWPTLFGGPVEVRRGAFHQVVLSATAVARIGKTPGGAARTAEGARVLEVVHQLGLPVRVPQLLAPVQTREGRSGFVTDRLDGESRPDVSWREVRGDLLPVLEALSAVQPTENADLPPARNWCGGAGWAAVVDTLLMPRLLPEHCAAAGVVVQDVLALDDAVPATLVHGDFNLHNLLWLDGSLSGLVDLDHAGVGDHAIDVAPLVGHFGTTALAADLSTDLLDRARVHRASLPLQVAAAAALVGDGQLRDHALGNFAARQIAGTSYDPFV